MMAKKKKSASGINASRGTKILANCHFPAVTNEDIVRVWQTSETVDQALEKLDYQITRSALLGRVYSLRKKHKIPLKHLMRRNMVKAARQSMRDLRRLAQELLKQEMDNA